MKKLFAGLAGVCAIALSAPANAQLADITVGTTQPVPPGAPGPGPTAGNQFSAQLAALGLTYYTNVDARIFINGPASLSYEFLGSESGYSDQFNAPGAALIPGINPETGDYENFWPAGVFLGSSPSLTGDLGHTAPSDGGNSLLWFSTADGGGDAAGIGEVGFGIFIPEAFANGGHYLTDVFYLGYDDRGAGPDDNHDDYIVRVTVTPTPEPGTWMTMLLGFGAAGMAMRYRRRKTAFAA